MEKISILAITKNGLKIGLKIKGFFPNWDIYAPKKFSDENSKICWYSNSTSEKIIELFNNSEGLICIFSLGAVIRLLAPHLKNKKVDPAVLVIDDQSTFVISVLSGHLGGANEMAKTIATKIEAIPVITTAADVNKTISVDLLGKELNWKIEDDTNVTRISAYMVNEEKIGVFQDVGDRNWLNNLPKNVRVFEKLNDLKNSDCKGYLLISDKIFEDDLLEKSVIYRPPSIVVGIGLHWDTSKDTIRNGLIFCLKKFKLSEKSIASVASIKKIQEVKGLVELANELQVPVEFVDKETLAEISTPNPSKIVKDFEGTASVSEASALVVSKGTLIVEKQKFPPNLTIAIARIPS